MEGVTEAMVEGMLGIVEMRSDCVELAVEEGMGLSR